MRSEENKNLKWVHLIRGILYIIVGLLFIITMKMNNMPLYFNIAFGSICLIYGFFRLLKVYQQYFKNTLLTGEEDDNEK